MKLFMKMGHIWIYLLIVLLVCSAHGHVKHFFYYSSPGGQAQGLPGLYGGYLNPDNYGKAYDLQQTAVKCAAMPPNGFYDGLNIKGISYDPYSDEVLLEIDELTDTQTSLIKAPLCQANICSQSEIYVFFSAGANTDRLQEAKLGPFARWKSDIYFVTRRYRKGTHQRQRIMRMSVYKLNGCHKEYPFTKHNPIDLDSCSEEVALILEETDEHVVLVMREKQEPTSTLHVIDSGTSLHFMVQVQHEKFSTDVVEEYSMDLYVAMQYEVQQPAQLLYSQGLPVSLTWYRLQNIGAIDYKHGVLCWSAIDRILCSKWKPGHKVLTEVHEVLTPGAAEQVCNGSGEFQGNVATGIAIAKESNSLTLYFGCISKWQNMGGAGLLTLDSEWSSSKVRPLLDNHGRVLAGNMFITEACENMPLLEATSVSDTLQADDSTKEEDRNDIDKAPGQVFPDKRGPSDGSHHIVSFPYMLTLCIILLFKIV